ncbi:glycosyltransferase [Schumannella sp. 10F1B-5-1]|uniref:glycosyltransferase n=1 Tax=Schumannella sp. 10F1B-5-1 TaxID=2590780 RepID=UPI001130A7E8|nr:glycosyltransferase [Schumannella sp. 10F1B-5-1]TPW73546.1 glycosyltransferase [Schumannella sp. 10F1B-5-1]
MRLAYLSDRIDRTHDLRFLDAWEASGVETLAVPVGSAHLERELGRFAPDVVQAGPIGAVTAAVSQVWQGALIVTSWGFDLIGPDRVDASLAERAIRRAELLFVDNLAVERRVLELGAEPTGIARFAWGVDLARIGLTRRARSNPAPTVVSARSHEPLYDVGTAIRAIAIARRSVPDLRAIIAGDGSETVHLRGLAHELGLDDSVEFVGRLAQTDLDAALADSDVYLSASLTDGSSITLLEAMALGTRCCVSDIPGNAEWIDERTGWTFPVGDPTRAAAGILAALNPEGDDRARAAAARVAAEADWAQTSARLPALARHAIGRGAAS